MLVKQKTNVSPSSTNRGMDFEQMVNIRKSNASPMMNLGS